MVPWVGEIGPETILRFEEFEDEDPYGKEA
jgi:hypothetical protein